MKQQDYENKVKQPRRRRVKVRGETRVLVLTKDGDWELVEKQPRQNEVKDARN